MKFGQEFIYKVLFIFFAPSFVNTKKRCKYEILERGDVIGHIEVTLPIQEHIYMYNF